MTSVWSSLGARATTSALPLIKGLPVFSSFFSSLLFPCFFLLSYELGSQCIHCLLVNKLYFLVLQRLDQNNTFLFVVVLGYFLSSFLPVNAIYRLFFSFPIVRLIK